MNSNNNSTNKQITKRQKEVSITIRKAAADDLDDLPDFDLEDEKAHS